MLMYMVNDENSPEFEVQFVFTPELKSKYIYACLGLSAALLYYSSKSYIYIVYVVSSNQVVYMIYIYINLKMR